MSARRGATIACIVQDMHAHLQHEHHQYVQHQYVQHQTAPPPSRVVATRARRGNVMLMVAVLMGALGLSLAAYALTQAALLRVMVNEGAIDAMGVAAEGMADVMTERLLAKAEWNLGVLTAADITELNAGLDSLAAGTLPSVPMPSGVTFQTDVGRTTSSYSFTVVDSGRVIPMDVHPLLLTTDAPFTRWLEAPLFGGARSGPMYEVQVRAQVLGKRLFTRTATARIVIAKVSPFQWAFYTNYGADLCNWAYLPTNELYVSGRTRIEGAATHSCGGTRRWTGEITTRDGWGNNAVRTAGDFLYTPVGTYDISNPLSAATMRAADSATLVSFQSRLKVSAGMSDYLPITQLAGTDIVGSGECADFTSACGGSSEYKPSVTVANYSAPGIVQSPSAICGAGFSTCSTVLSAMSYTYFPFVSAPAAGAAAADPANPTVFWRGLFPDPRRETYCTATTRNAGTYRTLRCPTNYYGYTIDMSALPAIPGGVMSIRKWLYPPGAWANPDGFQEIVWLKNATTLASALTIHSELPVAIEGDYNTIVPKAAMIDAPLILALPPTTSRQVQAAGVWDSTTGAPANNVPINLAAVRPVTIRAVLRARMQESVGGSYFGGVDQIPTPIGTWTGMPLTVYGAVEGVQMSGNAAGTIAASYSSTMANSKAGSFRNPVPPTVRRIVYDTLLWTRNGTPPGSWNAVGRLSGATPRRGATRQANATGGYTVMWFSQRPLLGNARLF